MTIPIFRLIFLATIVALIISPIAIRLARRFDFMDVPGSMPHKRHEYPVALTGGWALALSVILVSLKPVLLAGSPLVPVVLMSGVVFLFGVVDDRFSLSAMVKFSGQLIAAAGLIFLGVRVLLFPPSFAWLNILVSLFWLVGITNAFNFVDSMDGLAVGLAGISAGFFMIVSQEAGQSDLSAFCAVLVGACIGVYFLNANPTRMFLGDSGSQWLGFILAGVGIVYTPQGFLRSQSWFLPILLVGVPIFDTVLVVYSRLRRKQAVYKANLDHTYHRMVELGLHRNRAVNVMHIAALLMGSIAFSLLEMRPLWANLIFAAVILGCAVLILWLEKQRRKIEETS